MADSAPEDAISQYDPGMVKTDIGFYETLLHFHDIKKEHCIPAIVMKYDRDENRATVLPLVKYASDTPNGVVTYSRSQYEVPVHTLCCGGFMISFPLFVGDVGWLIAGDRNPTTAMEKNATQLTKDQDENFGDNEGDQDPDDYSITGYEWGFFLPDYFGKTGLKNEDGLVIGYKNDDEDKCVSVKINEDGVSIVRGEDGDSASTVSIDDDAITVERADDKVTISDDGIEYDGTPDRTQQFVTDVQYDISSHCVQKKTVDCDVRGDFIVGIGEESDWTTITGGQAVPEQTSDS